MATIALNKSFVGECYSMRYLVFGLMLMITLSFPTHDQNPTYELKQVSSRSLTSLQDSQAKDSATVMRDFKSPYSVLRFINETDDADLRKVWQWLGLNLDYTDMSYKCDGSCKAETFVIDANGEKNTVVKISYEAGNYYQYLIFRKLLRSASAGEWKLIGSVDSSYQQYGSPKHRVERSGTQTWLVIEELWGRGSGVSLYGEKWHELRETGVREVLAFPVSGHQSSFGDSVGRSFKAGVLGYESINGIHAIKVRFSVSYNVGLQPQEQLFSKDQLAFFVWDSSQRKFVLDESNSQLSEQEIEKVYNIDSLTNEQFVEYSLKELLEVAAHGSEKQKEWLRQFLPKLNASPERSELERALKP
jgi:hypothetical protein